METDVLQEDLCMFQECLSQFSAETERQRGMLQRLAGKAGGAEGKHRTAEQWGHCPFLCPCFPSCSGSGCVRGSVTPCGSSSQNSVVGSCFGNHCQELQQLEGLLAQCEEQREAACREAGTRGGEETQQVLCWEIRNLEEELEEEEACQLQRKKEAKTPESALPELVEEQMDALHALCRPGAGCPLWLLQCSTPPAVTPSSSTTSCCTCCVRRPTTMWLMEWEGSFWWSARVCCPCDCSPQ
nr:uncharacterized protein LOC110361480 isoform X2 [Columba livia]